MSRTQTRESAYVSDAETEASRSTHVGWAEVSSSMNWAGAGCYESKVASNSSCRISSLSTGENEAETTASACTWTTEGSVMHATDRTYASKSSNNWACTNWTPSG